MMLTKNYDKSQAEVARLSRELEDLRKGNTSGDAQLRTVQDLHAQKIKTLLKSINNLKKELAQQKFEQKENVRIQKIQLLQKDIELMEVGMGALRGHIRDEELCD